MNISFRIRRERMIAAAVLGLALGGFAAALPARASATPDAVGTPVVTDNISGDLATTANGTDDIVTCAPSEYARGSVQVYAVPAGCLTMYNGEWLNVNWTPTGTGTSTKLTQQTDGNFVLYAGNGKTWSAATTRSGNVNGPGCLALFLGDGNLVVRDCGTATLWDTGIASAAAVLAFQSDGNLVIYASATATAKALWSSKTY